VAIIIGLEWRLPPADALEDAGNLLWFSRFLQRLLENEPSVLALLGKSPFPDRPPFYVRAQFYEYRFADSQEGAKGLWWHRRLLGPYFPTSRLSNK
jgi:hypothetical protein